MAATSQDKTPSKSAIKQLRNEDSTFLQFKMVDGVHPVLRLARLSTNMANLRPASQMAKVDHGPTRFTTSQVSLKLGTQSSYSSETSVIAVSAVAFVNN